MKKTYIIIKRLSDFTLSFILCILLFPAIIAISALIFLEMGFPIFFKQKRVGKDNKVFTIYKFRTMNNKRDDNGELLPDMLRLTPIGSTIRRLSLDEVPQLFNILRGEMSFIGPRPLLIEYIPLYSKEQIRRHEVLPGISGLAQVTGRNNTTWKKRFESDIYYVDHIGFLMDIKIFFLTIKSVLMPKDINNSENDTMPKFKGDENNG